MRKKNGAMLKVVIVSGGTVLGVLLSILLFPSLSLAVPTYCTWDAPFWHFNRYPVCDNYGTPVSWSQCVLSAPNLSVVRIDSNTVKIVATRTTPCTNKAKGMAFYKNGKFVKNFPASGFTYIDTNAPVTQTITYEAANFDGYLNCGCSPLAAKVVLKNSPPNVSISPSSTTGKAPLNVTFTLSASDPDGDPITSWSFECGNGQIYSGTSWSGSIKRNCTYNSVGTFTPKFTATDKWGLRSSVKASVVITGVKNSAPSAMLTPASASGIAPYSVTFTLSASDPDGINDIASWNLNCGNGKTFSGTGWSGNTTRTCTYSQAGNYTATFKVTDKGGLSGTDTSSVKVGANSAPSTTLLSPTNNQWVGTRDVTFKVRATDADGDRVKVCFDLDANATCDYTSSLLPSGSIFSWTTTLPDTNGRKWRARAIDERGTVGSWTPAWTVRVDTTPPVVDLLPNSSAINTNQSVTFTFGFGSRTYDNGSGISSWTLSCGNGTSFYGTSTTVTGKTCTYTSAGTFYATFTVRDKVGNINSDTSIVTVSTPNRPPIASIQCSPSSCQAIQGDILTLLNKSTDPDGIGDIVKSVWRVIEVGALYSCNGVCNYTVQTSALGTGVYTASLQVTDSKGQKSSTTKTFNILRRLKANLLCSLDGKNYKSCNLISPLVNQPVYIKDVSVPSQGANILSRTWSFQDASPSSSSAPSLIVKFTSPGIKRVVLNVRDSLNKESQRTANINVVLPIPRWTEIEPF